MPDWYPGSSVPEKSEQSDNAWSDDSDDNYENDEEM